jgi:hypothetical protein
VAHFSWWLFSNCFRYPFLMPLVPSGSLLRREQVQLCNHNLPPRVQPDHLYYVIYCVTTLYPVDIRAWVTFVSCGWADRVTCHLPRGSPRSWTVCRNAFSYGHRTFSGVGGHNCGCCVDEPLHLPRYSQSNRCEVEGLFRK